MAELPSDYSLIGMVLAISMAIILLSGLALYVAFRLRETLREERGRGARAAKVGFLIGLLFLSGGIFYFFAIGFSSLGGTAATLTSSTTSESSIASSTTSTASSSPTTSISTSSSTASSSTSPAQGSLSLSSSFPPSENAGSTFFGSFTMIDNGSVSVGSVSVQVGNLLNEFAFQSCTISVNGGVFQDCTSSLSGNVISLGSVTPGTTVITLGLKAPSHPGQYSNEVTLYYFLGTQRSILTTITIHITP